MVDMVGRGPGVAARTTVRVMLENWFSVASNGWAPTTIRQTRSVLDSYLHRHLGDLAVADVTAATIDSVYATLRRSEGVR